VIFSQPHFKFDRAPRAVRLRRPTPWYAWHRLIRTSQPTAPFLAWSAAPGWWLAGCRFSSFLSSSEWESWPRRALATSGPSRPVNRIESRTTSALGLIYLVQG